MGKQAKDYLQELQALFKSNSRRFHRTRTMNKPILTFEETIQPMSNFYKAIVLTRPDTCLGGSL
ncbi:hypothetical protein BJV82DRAFT_621106 [Fennellomyces sp. T-0311]|nr:hypothetical protein BJV82DRAFT_621106 [Fennellomyces sp. T-0311]